MSPDTGSVQRLENILPQRTAQIDSEVEELLIVTKRYEILAFELEEALSRVLRPRPEEAKNVGAVPVEFAVPLASDIRSHRQSVARNNSALESILSRLEV